MARITELKLNFENLAHLDNGRADRLSEPLTVAGKDRFGAYLMIDDFRCAMPSVEVATKLSAAFCLHHAAELSLRTFNSGEWPGPACRALEAAIAKATGP